MIQIEIADDEITTALDGLMAHLGDMTEVMQEIGELLMVSTKERFPTGQAPDGSKWAAKSSNTQGNDRRPLFGPTGLLSQQIFYEAGPASVELGSNRVYAAMMHFGGSKAAFPHLWGDIPARPFIGLSESDRTGILETVEEWLQRSVKGSASGN
jgi:phage virion morphogenesis protein